MIPITQIAALVRQTRWSTLVVLAECKRLGWWIVGPDGASATVSFSNDALTRQDWLDGAAANWGLEPALAVVTRRQRSQPHTTLYLTIRVPWGTELWFVGSSARPTIVMNSPATSCGVSNTQA